MIDFHSHILPKMDDGSKSVEESLELLKMLAQQGIDRVVATPHFYANDESVSSFLGRRQAAYDSLAPHLTPDLPQILLGAEVRYYQGISRLVDLRSLCIEGTNLLLLEMTVSHWTEHTAKEIVDLSCLGNLTIVLAHIERYLGLQSRRVREQIAQADVLMQVNADYFTGLSRHKALRQLEEGSIQLIGSDCHDVTHRPPCIGKAIDLIRKKKGEDLVQYISGFADSLLCKTK